MIRNNAEYDWLKQLAATSPNASAVISGSTNLTYAELYDDVMVKAAECKSIEITAGKPVLVPAEFNIEFVKSVLALWEVGAVPVPVNPDLTEEEITTIESELPSWLDNETALIMFTSGTSGIPKGVQLTFNNLYAGVIMLNNFMQISKGDTWLASLPFNHIGGFSIITRPLITEGRLIIPNNNGTESLSKAISKYAPSFISLVPTMLKRLMDTDVTPPGSLKATFIGGAKSDNNLLLKANKLGWEIHKVYGATETCAMVTILPPDDLQNKTESVGKPFEGTIISIDEENHNEIVIEGRSIAKGYINSTDDSIKKNIYHTNDKGFIDNEGYLYLLGRIDDMIITGGKNIDSYEVEMVLLSVEGISEVYVFPMDDEEWGQSVNAAVTVSEESITESGIKKTLKKKLSSYKVPKRIFILETFPKTDIGKIDKSALMELVTPDAT